MDIQIYDNRLSDDSSLQLLPRISTYAQLQQYCNAAADRSKGWEATPLGSLCWVLTGFSIDAGPAVFKATFVQGPTQIRVVRSWPDASKLNYTLTPDYSGGTGVDGWTKPDGTIEYSYGGGSAYVGKMGVDKIWPLVPTAPGTNDPVAADCAVGLGWFGGTVHVTVNPIFTLMRRTATTTPNPTEDMALYVIIDGENVGTISILPPNQPDTNKLVLMQGGTEYGTIIIER